MFYFIRHAQSQFNYQFSIKLLNQLGPEEYSKKDERYTAVKFDRKFVDSELTQEGKKQCLLAQEEMKDVDIDLILVSPMRRALQTCDIIFREHATKPKILVQPGIRQIFSSSCDIGSRLHQSMKQIPYFDYSLINDINIWYIESIKNKEILKYFKEKLEGFQGEAARLKAEEQMLSYLKSVFKQKDQYHLSDFQGQRLRLLEYGKKYKNIAVVSHYENIFEITKIPPKNAQVLKIKQQEI